jgi:DNA-binding response OmpR family regulator
VILLDLGLPDIDGLELCQRLRARSSAAIIAVTARSEEATRVATLDAGADDYLIKPFGFVELLARVRAVLRRINPAETGQLRHGALTVDPRTRRVFMADRDIALTPKEFDLLSCLAEDPGRALTRQEILERAWGGHWYGPSKVLDVHVASLRRKLGDPALIETVYGVGYRLASIE